jgi:apolipoprotein N-acyltransferase
MRPTRESLFGSIWVRYPAAVVSAVLVAFAYPPYNLGWLAWIGIVPLFLVIHNLRRRDTYIIAGIWTLVFIIGIMDFYFLSRSPVFILIVIAGLIIQTVIIAESSMTAQRYPRYGRLILPCLWMGAAFLISFITGLFSPIPPDIPIPTPANTQWLYSPVVQITSVTGEYVLYLLILLVNSSLAQAIRRIPYRRWWTPAAISMPILVLCIIWGVFQLSANNASNKAGIAIVPAGGSLTAEFSPFSMTRQFVEESDRNRVMPDGSLRPETGIIAWAEIPAGDINDKNTVTQVSNFAAEMKRYMVINFYDEQSDGTYLNVAAVFSPDGTLTARNAKRRIPPIVEGSTAGSNKEPIETVDTPWGEMTTLICYDTFFPQLARRAAAEGSDFIIVPANPASDTAPRFTALHLSQTMLRAVENHTAIALSYASGLSALIDANGKLVMHEPLDPKTYMESSVAMAGALPIEKGGTLYSRIGDIFAWIVVAASVIWIMVIEAKRRNNPARRT